MITDEDELVPIGIHFQGLNGKEAGAIGLWTILEHNCRQNFLTSLTVQFVSFTPKAQV
jgi:hypothetical protein